jgi:predicted RNase H-like nuclease (RuvC/YqgF family)
MRDAADDLERLSRLVAWLEDAHAASTETIARMSDENQRLRCRIREMQHAGTSYSAERDAMNALILQHQEDESEIKRLREAVDAFLAACDNSHGHCLWPEIIAACEAAEVVRNAEKGTKRDTAS